MREDDINSLISHCKNMLITIRKQYSAALNSKTIPSDLIINTKNYMENLRSTLDYIAHDIYELFINPIRSSSGQNRINHIYFPYGKDENSFKSTLGSSLPDLKMISPELYDIIESIQPHRSGDSWLYDFCSILNDQKHNRLSPQKKYERKGLHIKFGNGAFISIPPGGYIGGSGFIGNIRSGIPLNGNIISGDHPAKNTIGSVNQKIIIWTSFKFENTEIEVMPLLRKTLIGITNLKNRIYSIFKSNRKT